jgi:hypothetical protein
MRSASRFALVALGLLASIPAAAVPTTGLTITDLPTCDVLSAPATMEELGLGPTFPAGSQIQVIGAVVTAAAACSSVTDNPLLSNLQIGIKNLNSISFSAVYYVANAGTVFTNVDGTINLLEAMRIDATGTNANLVSEDITADGIFEPGETWQFILQDWTHPTLTAGTFNQIGVPDTNLPPTASGNILAVPVPEPGTAALVGLGLLGIGLARPRAR